MKFERARSAENKKIRLNQIKKVASEMLEEMPYHKITLSAIGNRVDFDRTNVYKYVKTKDEIFLYILMDALNEYTEDLEEAFKDFEGASIEEVSKKLTSVLTRHDLYLKLNSMLYPIFERNSNLRILTEFNKYAESQYDRIAHVFSKFLHNKDEAHVVQFMTHLHSFIIGLYPISNPSENQLKATEGLNLPRCLDLDYEINCFIVSILKGGA